MTEAKGSVPYGSESASEGASPARHSSSADQFVAGERLGHDEDVNRHQTRSTSISASGIPSSTCSPSPLAVRFAEPRYPMRPAATFA